MSEIAGIIGVSTLVLYAVIVVSSWRLRLRSAGPRERALFVRWSAYGALFSAVVAGWVTAGVAIFLSRSEFWRGVWVGGMAVLWLGYVPALVLVIRVAVVRPPGR
jgi:hypothetical protein